MLHRRLTLAGLLLSLFSVLALAQQPSVLPDDPSQSFVPPPPAAPAPSDNFAAPPYESPASSSSDSIQPDPHFAPIPDTQLVASLHTQTANLFPLLSRAFTASKTQPSTPEQLEEPERYHWKGLLWQSFAFFGIENAFRLLNDPSLRYNTAEKPFWHDYIASVRQWNMGRWSDGDDFLVAWVGHPLQGSVTEFIEIQNSPRYRATQMGDPGYLKSRFIALLYATAYSTDQKVGPLGETAIGSEGGYTYIIGCAYDCPNWDPATQKVTNNTGWVKLISTPVGGTVWTMTEDFIDRYISDRIQGDDLNRVFPKIFRGAINPSRTMANALRGKKPWYRDYQHPEDSIRSGFWQSATEEQMRTMPRYEFFPHADLTSMVVNDSVTCYPCRHIITTGGIGFDYLLSRWWDVEADINHHNNTSTLPSNRSGGNSTVGTFGIAYGFRTPNYGLKIALRPGFLSYSDAYMTWPITLVPQQPGVGASRPAAPAEPTPTPITAPQPAATPIATMPATIQTTPQPAIERQVVQWTANMGQRDPAGAAQRETAALLQQVQQAAATGTEPEIGRITHFTTVLAVTGDYGIARNLALRFSFGNAPVRYYTFRMDRPPGVGTWPYLYWISPKIYATNENWAYQMGPVLRF